MTEASSSQKEFQFDIPVASPDAEFEYDIFSEEESPTTDLDKKETRKQKYIEGYIDNVNEYCKTDARTILRNYIGVTLGNDYVRAAQYYIKTIETKLEANQLYLYSFLGEIQIFYTVAHRIQQIYDELLGIKLLKTTKNPDELTSLLDIAKAALIPGDIRPTEKSASLQDHLLIIDDAKSDSNKLQDALQASFQDQYDRFRRANDTNMLIDILDDLYSLMMRIDEKLQITRLSYESICDHMGIFLSTRVSQYIISTDLSVKNDMTKLLFKKCSEEILNTFGRVSGGKVDCEVQLETVVRKIVTDHVPVQHNLNETVQYIIKIAKSKQFKARSSVKSGQYSAYCNEYDRNREIAMTLHDQSIENIQKITLTDDLKRQFSGTLNNTFTNLRERFAKDTVKLVLSAMRPVLLDEARAKLLRESLNLDENCKKIFKDSWSSDSLLLGIDVKTEELINNKLQSQFQYNYYDIDIRKEYTEHIRKELEENKSSNVYDFRDGYIKVLKDLQQLFVGRQRPRIMHGGTGGTAPMDYTANLPPITMSNDPAFINTFARILTVYYNVVTEFRIILDPQLKKAYRIRSFMRALVQVGMVAFNVSCMFTAGVLTGLTGRLACTSVNLGMAFIYMFANVKMRKDYIEIRQGAANIYIDDAAFQEDVLLQMMATLFSNQSEPVFKSVINGRKRDFQKFMLSIITMRGGTTLDSCDLLALKLSNCQKRSLDVVTLHQGYKCLRAFIENNQKEIDADPDIFQEHQNEPQNGVKETRSDRLMQKCDFCIKILEASYTLGSGSLSSVVHTCSSFVKKKHPTIIEHASTTVSSPK